MNPPLVTIVTPSFNQAQFLRATIESVLSQDYPRIEYIIMDGGSTDASAAVAAEYGSRLQWFSERDHGQSHALNKGYRRAKGDIFAWINSDDVLLPGAVRCAVEGFRDNPRAGAVYGEGFLMDIQGNFKCRFPHTRPFDLWSLYHVSDYVLQQTMFFRAEVYEEVGGIREDYHWTLDWDLLIRIGKRHPLVYLPYYMGALREHADAKTFYGGRNRSREIGRMLREHTGMMLPPGWIVYGLDTFAQIWRARFSRWIPGAAGELAQMAVTYAAGLATLTMLRQYEGWYENGWVSPRVRYMLPAAGGDLLIEGELPDNQWLAGQTITVHCNGLNLGSYRLPKGPFCFRIPTSGVAESEPAHLDLRASHAYIPTHFGHIHDARRLAYRIERITWADWA